MLSGIILAGGRSSRMGTPKALLPFDAEPLIVHIVRALQPMVDEIVVVAAPGQQLPSMPVTLVHDEVAYQGPVGGIHYGLAASTGEFAFVTSCDVAFSSRALIEHLLALRDDYDVVVPRWEGRYQPLFAVYRRTVLPLLTAQLESGQLRPVSLFEKVRTRTVDEEEIRSFDPDGESFLNMNEPADYQRALARWQAARQRPDGGGAITCVVELFGVARMLAGRREVPITLSNRATLAHVFAAVSEQVPVLAGPVIAAGGTALADGYACNVNGLEFVRDAAASINAGDRILILSADAGG